MNKIINHKNIIALSFLIASLSIAYYFIVVLPDIKTGAYKINIDTPILEVDHPTMVPQTVLEPTPTSKPITNLEYDNISIGKKIKEKYPVYSKYPDSLIGDLYIKKYINGERSNLSIDISCTSNVVGDYTYTECY